MSDSDGMTVRGRVVATLVGVLAFALLCAALEGAARLAIYWRYGSAQHGSWDLYYEPYVLFKWSKRPRPEYPAKGDRYRIVLLGGSTAALMPPPVLEEAFASALKDDVEVINLAQGGYIMTQELISLTIFGMPLEPDLIITLDGYNDIINGVKTGDPLVHYWNSRIDFAMNHPELNALYALGRNSQFINAIVKLRERSTEAGRYQSEEIRRRTLKHFEEGIASIAAIAKALHAEYISVLQPYAQMRTTITPRERDFGTRQPDQNQFVIESMRMMDERLSEMAGREDMYYVNGTTAFDATDVECFTDEAHLTEAGNRIFAGHVVRGAEEQGFSGRTTH